VLQKKYHIDREFKIILLLSGEMDEQMTRIDHLLCDEKLLELMEADFSKRYPLSTKTGRKSTKRRSDIKDANPEAHTLPKLRKHN
jgi:IS5 family transposase